MKNLSSYVPAKKWPGIPVDPTLKALPQVLDFELKPMAYLRDTGVPTPKRLLMVRINPDDPSADQLFLNHVPLPREAWCFDTHERTLIWHGAYGGGWFKFGYDNKTCTGIIGEMSKKVNMVGGARVQFTCDVALGAGVDYIYNGADRVTGIYYDPASSAWKSASWQENRLRMTYVFQDPQQPAFTFEDLYSGDIPWEPIPDFTDVSIELTQPDNSPIMVWKLSFESFGPPPDDYGAPSGGANSVYPWWLEASEDPGVTMIVGGMEIDDVAPNGTLVGIQGLRTSVYINGYYRTSGTTMAFGIFDGKMMVDGKTAGHSWITGNKLYWHSLPEVWQQKTGLPEKGSLVFNKQGSKGINKENDLQAYRLSAAAAAASISHYMDQYPEVQAKLEKWNHVLASGPLSITGLLSLTPFKKDQTGQWYDAIQVEVTNDLSDIMNSFIDPTMWKLLFPTMNQPQLTGYLAKVANSPVKGFPDPGVWYQSLSTAVLTEGMAQGNDKNCENMNGPRAAAWLSTQVSASPVYYAHGQQLFQIKWLDAYPAFEEYLSNQANDPGGILSQQIDSMLAGALEDIDNDVITDKNSPPNLKQMLKDQAIEAAEYARSKNLYWAYNYYNYFTSPGSLGTISHELNNSVNNNDSTVLMRQFQTVSTVLTALDDSGFFTRQYNSTVNVFMSTNILPSMYGFNGDPESFSLIKEYLQQFVDDNINSEDKAMADAAAQIREVIQQENYPDILYETISAMNALAETIDQAMAFPYVANKLVTWFSKTYPWLSSKAEMFCGALTSGLMIMNAFNLYKDFRKWSDLTPQERTTVIFDSLQLGIQMIGGMVKRGVRIYSLFTSSSFGTSAGYGSLAKVFFLGKDNFADTSLLDGAITDLGSDMAKWVGGTEGSFTKMMLQADEIESTYLLLTEGQVQVPFLYKVLGKNLDEFISTRLGVVFILAGMGWNIYLIASGDAGWDLAVDIINLVAGSLMLLATVGTMIAAGTLATILCCAGPLAIVAALAGIALTLYLRFRKKPDPVKQFVDQYCKPAGFYVSAKCSAIDYAVSYKDPDQNDLMMLGSTFSSNGQYLLCNTQGIIELGQNDNMPAFVWVPSTDGLGMSQICAYTLPEGFILPVMLYLSLLSDNTICFAASMADVKYDLPRPENVTIITQTWLSSPQGSATLSTNGAFLKSLPMLLQPVLPDSSGNYAPSQAKGYIQQSGNGVVYNLTSSTSFTLTMAPIAPNYIRMADLTFRVDTRPNKYQEWTPIWGVQPSTPITYTNQGDLPPFLDFDSTTGTYSPNGDKAEQLYNSSNTVTLSNAAGQASATFTIAVIEQKQVPEIVTLASV